MDTIEGSIAIKKGDRIAQLVFSHYVTVFIQEKDALQESSDGRNDAGFGSTGT
jgi:dUTPase